MATPDHSGRRVGGFELLAPLASGGFATVYRARQVRLDREVAVKVLDPALARDSEIAARFEREGRAAASLDHPNVVTVYEAGEDDGLVYLAMRLVEGETLDQLLLRRGPLTTARTADYIGPVGDALDHAHERGLIHRDVKPSNIFIDGDRVWLGDFGIAATADQVGRYTTGALGTAHYMAPEQASQGELDGRADLYALGCVVHRCLTGRPPYDRGELVATLVAHVNEPVPETGQPDLDRFLAVALAKAPDERFQHGADLVAALKAVGPVGDVSAASGPAVPASGSQPAPPTQARPTGAPSVAASPPEPPPPVPPPAVADSTTRSPQATQPGGLPPPTDAPRATPVPVAPAERSPRRWPFLVVPLLVVALAVGGWLVLGGGDGGSGSGGVVGEPIAVGEDPRAVATGSGSVFVANVGDQTLTEVPAGDGEPAPPAPLQAEPVDLAVDEAGGVVWVSTTAPDRTLLRLDLEGLRIAPVSLGFEAGGVTADADGAWVADPGGGRVVQVDAAGDEQGEVLIDGRPTDVVLASGSLWVAAGGAVVQVDPEAGAVTGTRSLDGSADEIAASTDAVYVTDRTGATLTRISIADPSVSTTVEVVEEPTSPSVGAGGVWLIGPDAGTAHGYDGDTLAELDVITVGGVLGGLGIEGGDLWVTRADGDELVPVTPAG